MASIAVIGNGPSLKDFDLPSLGYRPSIGMNAAYRYWDRVNWYPAHYVCLDDAVVVSHKDGIMRLVEGQFCRTFFLHHSILEHEPGLLERDNVFFLASFADAPIYGAARVKYGLPVLDNRFFFHSDHLKVTTGSHALRYGCLLGYSEMLLLGIDANYVQVVDGAVAREGIRLEIANQPAKNQNYFFDDYQQVGDIYNLPTPPRYGDLNFHASAFELIGPELRENGIDVWIGTQKSELFSRGLFPYVDPYEFLPRLDFDLPDFCACARQPRYVPAIASPLVLSHTQVTEGVERDGIDRWYWPSHALGLDKGTLRFIVGEPGGVRGGAFSGSLNIWASREATGRIRLCRHGNGPWEADGKSVVLGRGANFVPFNFILREHHEAVRLSFELDKKEGDGEGVFLQVDGVRVRRE